MIPEVNKDWAETFFDEGFEETFRRLGKYDSTEPDLMALLELVPIPLGGKILDVACGWGRHAGFLYSRGFSVVGVDLSAAQIKRARARWPHVTFYQCDMRRVPESEFDAVLNLWTSFGALPTREDDIDALRSWFRSTRDGGCLVMELTTREYAEASNRIGCETVGHKSVTINGVTEDAIFDWDKGVSYNTYTRGDWKRTCVTRLYRRSELHDMLTKVGYSEIHQFGSFSGSPIRNDARTIIVAWKR